MSAAVRDLFHELAGRSQSQREDYYAREGVPADVRAELESLFLFDNSGGDTIAKAVGCAAGRLLRTQSPCQEGTICGPYRLIRQIGEGGMGSVFLAERADGEVEQQVAFKFIRPGFDVPSLMRRFLRERQILASLNHPGIARLLDVGRSGPSPYLVMEYVEGTRIDEYAGGRGERAIAALMRQVADSVAHAHRNLIIHRDLKPSNILVDAAGNAKLLDFGIAKIVETSDETHTMDRLMTPDYASPEQVGGGAQTTATDIYSLGAVIYHLLTGRLPRRPLDFSEMSADMAAIVRMAMREEPAERYASADLLAADLDAFAADRPVAARRGNVFYAVRKFAGRHRLAVGASVLAVAGLAAGLIVAGREREVAQRRFEQVKEASRQFQEMEGRLRRLPGATKERGDLVVSALKNLEMLAVEARPSWFARKLDNEMALEIGNAYLLVGRVQGVPVNPNLGRLTDAKASLIKAEQIVDQVLASAEFARDRRANLISAQIAQDAMIVAEMEQRNADLLRLTRKSIDRANVALEGAPLTPNETATVVRAYANAALSYSNAHRMEEAVQTAGRTVEIARGVGDDPFQLSKALGIAANVARNAGQVEQALRFVQEARALAEKQADYNRVDFVIQYCASLWREGLILGELNNINLNRPQAAIPLLQRALDLADGLAAKDPDDHFSRSYVSMAGRELGDILRDSNPSRALAVYDRAARRMAEVKNNRKARREEIWLLTGSAYALRKLGRSGEAKARLDKALSQLGAPEAVELGSEADTYYRARADHLAETGRGVEAAATYKELLRLVHAAKPTPELDLRHANAMSRLYLDLARLQKPADAAELRARAVALWRHWDQKLPRNPFVLRQLAAAQK